MPGSVLRTKLFVPPVRPGLVFRPSLLEKFSSGLDCPLTLLSAPAGYGKSTFLGMWVEKKHLLLKCKGVAQPVVAWLSLDSQDNAPARFWLYVLAALKYALESETSETATGPFDEFMAFLQADGQPSFAYIDGLLNLVVKIDKTFILVLEDYHVIQLQEIHDTLAYLLDHLPPNLRLVVSTRVDPPLPLPRLRGRGQVSEFRSADLRFNTSEMVQFFKETAGFTLTKQDAEDIEISTEGWPAGLHMVALALKAQYPRLNPADLPPDEVRRFIDSFSGKNMFIIDYLAEEVFNCQPEHIRSFLLRTSVLERMCAGLCDELVGQGEPGAGKSRDILEYLDHTNLFVIPLDGERRWYRYHHLFADLLRVRLSHIELESIRRLHFNASRWYERENLPGEAVLHAMKAGDQERVATLIEQYIEKFFYAGELATVVRWAEMLDDAALRTRPVLCVQLAWALGTATYTERLEDLLNFAWTALSDWESFQAGEGEKPPFDLSPPQVDKVRGTITLLTGIMAIYTGRAAEALSMAQNTLAMIETSSSRESAYLNYLAGYASRGLGDLNSAVRYYTVAIDTGLAPEMVVEQMLFKTDLGICYRVQGKLSQAQKLFLDTLEWAKRQGIKNHGYLSRVEAYLSALLLEQNLVDEALIHARRALEYMQRWPSHNYIATTQLNLGLALMAAGDIGRAEEAITSADRERKKGPVTPYVHSQVECALMQLWLAKPDWQASEQLARDLAAELLPGESNINEYTEMKLMALARFYLAKARYARDEQLLERAYQLLQTLEQTALAGGRARLQLEAALQKSICLYVMARYFMAGEGAKENMKASLKSLQAAIATAEKESYLRLFINEGWIMEEMLAEILKGTKASDDSYPGASQDFIIKVLGLFPGGKVSVQSHPANALMETLTEREHEVLQLLGEGLSNKEMAKKLFLTEGTIKTHVHNVLGKLGAQSRSHAVARGRELRLL